jgi:hypothetical protein
MIPQEDTQMINESPDPLEQAGELLLRLHRGKTVTGGGIERDAATVIAAVTYAAAVELRRVGDLLESLCDFAHSEGLAADLIQIMSAQHAGRNGGR